MRIVKTRSLVIVLGLVVSGCSALWPFGDSKKESGEPVAAAPTASQPSVAPAAAGQTAAVAPAPNPPASAAPATTADAESESADVDTRSKSADAPLPPDVAAGGATSVSAASHTDSGKSGDPALTQARTTARLDELESEIRRLREKVKLLEQGLLTGIAPDDLKHPKSGKSVKADKNSTRVSEDSDLSKPEIEDLSLPPGKKAEAVSGGDSAINARFQVAKEHYQAGRFGMAVAELAGLSREYGPKVHDGAVKAWLGKSYLALKEYSTARGEFEFYLKEWPSGALMGDVRLGLAKTYFAMGLRERARVELKRVIKDFDGQEYSEIASAELQKMQGSL